MSNTAVIEQTTETNPEELVNESEVNGTEMENILEDSTSISIETNLNKSPKQLLGQKLKTDENNRIFNRYFYKFFKSTELEPDTFLQNAAKLLEKVKAGEYPLHPRKSKSQIENQINAIDKLVDIFKGDTEKLLEFTQMSREEKEAVLKSHS